MKMPIDVLLIRDGNRLSAADTLSAEAIATLDHNRQYVATIKNDTRNLRHHRKFMVLVNLVFQNQSQFATADHLRSALTIAVGHFDLVHTFKGRPYPVPRSIAFGKMGQAAFSEFYDRAVQAILTHILPHANRVDLEAQVMEILVEHPALPTKQPRQPAA